MNNTLIFLTYWIWIKIISRPKTARPFDSATHDGTESKLLSERSRTVKEFKSCEGGNESKKALLLLRLIMILSLNF